MKPSAKTKIITAIAVLGVFLVTVVATLLAERWVTFNPTPVVESGTAVGEEEEAEPLPIGSTEDSPVRFSLGPGFYSSSQRLYLSAADAVRIKYTKDGSDPSREGAPYSDGISLKLDDEVSAKIYTISACAEYADGSFSETVTRSFIVGSNIWERFDCMVFSITCDPEYLYNYEDGIFILGKMRDDYLATNPTKEIQPTDPANWNQRGMAGERPAYVEVYEYDGTCVISQSCGMRIFGGWSRANNQKNLRLYARSEYDQENNRFRYEFFPDAQDSNGDILKSAKKLALRACANDNGALFARDDTMSYLAMSTCVDSKHSRPAAVFLNGEYYGFAWLQEVFSEDWLDHTYNVEDGVWDILKGCEYMIRDDADNDIDEARQDWVEMQALAYTDLTDDENFSKLESQLDIDNFITYHALNSYIGNGDWPNNNYKVYRYVSGDGSASSAQDRLDGRWRYLLFDTDFSLGLYGTDFLEKHICRLFDEEFFGRFPKDWDLDVHDDGEKYWRSDLLISMCKRPEIRDKFALAVLDMMNWHYSPERTCEMLETMHTLRLHELVEAGNAGTASVWSVERELETAKNWITKRPYSAKLQLTQIFPEAYSENELFTIYAEATDNAVIKISSCEISEDEEHIFAGEYFNAITVPLDCDVAEGWTFEYWTVNGERIYDKSTELSFSKYGERVNVYLTLSCDDAGLDIGEVCYKGSNDYIVLHNYSDEPISTSGMTLSDGEDKEAFQIPAATIEPGRSLKLICKNYSRQDAIGSVECPFALKEGEVLTLCDSSGEVLSRLLLRDAADGTALKYNPYTDRYEAYTPYPKTRILEAELPSWGDWGWGGWG